jgi:hypothetical protein
MRNLLSSAVLIILMIVGIAGCSKTRITDLPPDVSEKQVQTWYAATGIVKTIAETTRELTGAVIATNASDPKLIPADDYQKILLALAKTAQAGIHADAILKKAPDNFGKGIKDQILAEIAPVVTEIQKADLEGLFSKSPSPRMQAALTTVKTLTKATNMLLQLAR